MPDRAQVERFLTNFKEVANSEGSWHLERRNWDSLAELGLTEVLAKGEVVGLGVEDYSDGPIADDNPLVRGNVFIFGKDIDGIEVYIKLKIVHIEDKRIARCLSFHPAERRLEHPFAE